MTRLKNILLAGTLVPALILPPLQAGWAQAPGGLDRGGPGAPGGPGARGGAEAPHSGAEGQRGGAGRAEHPEGGAGGGRERAQRPEGNPGGRPEHAPAQRAGEAGEPRGSRQERAAPGAAPAERGREPAAERRTAPPAAERAAAPPKAAPAERAAERPIAPGRTTPAERAGAPGKATPAERAAERPAAAGKTTPAERAAERPAAAGKITPAERAAQRPAAAGKTTPAERAAERPAEAGKVTPAEKAERPGVPGKTTPAEKAAERPAASGRTTPAEKAAERPGAPDKEAPGERAAERPGAPGRMPPAGRAAEQPGRATPAEGAPGAPPAAAAGRYNDPSTPQGGGFKNGDNSRGNAYTGHGNDNRGQTDRGDNRRGGISPGGAAAIGAAAGFAGGFLAATGARDLEGIRNDRRETVEDGRTYIREPGRTIVDEGGGRAFIVHDENDRFRDLGYNVHRERRGGDYVDRIDRPDGVQILTFTTPDGRLLRRVRHYRDGREVVLLDNSSDGGRLRPYSEDVVDLPPPRYDLPRERYDVNYADADEGSIYETLIAPPVARPPRRYTLDQILYSPDIRRYVRSVDINTINFASGSWVVPASATGKLKTLGQAIRRAVAQNPNSVFLVEGYTDATGNPNDNLSLSDHRAQSVAAILSKDFGVPPENLTTQGYGQQDLKVNTQGPSVENRRVVVQNITQLMADNGGNAPPPR